MKTAVKFTLGLVAALALTISQAQAQFSLTTTYTQNFDSMGTTGTTAPTGWFVGTGVTNGALTATTILVGTGSGTTGGNYNFGSNGVNLATDRALGSLGSGSTARLTEFRFTNNTGLTIDSLTISWTGEQYRVGGTAAVDNELALFYSTDGSTFTAAGTDAFDFHTPVDAGTAAALDGNAAANRVTGLGGTISALSIADGATFYLRWVDGDSPSSENAVSIDDLTIAFTTVPEPSTVSLVGLGLVGMLTFARRRRS